MIRIYHNPRCSKSRQTLKLLLERGLEPEVVPYLEETPDTATLDTLCRGLGIEPHQLARSKEARYAELGLSAGERSRADWLQVLHDNPILIERPIVVNGDRVALGRPPEAVLEII